MVESQPQIASEPWRVGRAELEDPSRTVAAIDGWMSGQAMTDLVVAFGGGVVGLRGAELANYLRRFAAEHWDFRHGLERQQISPPKLGAKYRQLTMRAAEKLGVDGRRAHELVGCGHNNSSIGSHVGNQGQITPGVDAASRLGRCRTPGTAERSAIPAGWRTRVAASDWSARLRQRVGGNRTDRRP